MAKSKYKFNSETLSYEKIEKSGWHKFGKMATLFATSLALALVMVVITLTFYETPRTKALRRENNELQAQYRLMQKDLNNLEVVLDEMQQRDDNLYRIIFEAEPIPSSVRKAGFGGSDRYSKLESFDNNELIINTAKKLDIVTKQAYIQSKSYDEVLKMALEKEKMLSSIPAIQPVANKNLKRTASGWGKRLHPIYKVWKMHYGIDFTAPTGTPIYATGDGVVTEVKGSRRARAGFGLMVKINHGYTYETLYGHLSAFNVRQGQKVKRGDVIGYVGNTGGSTAPHLHYEVHKNGKKVNPTLFFFQDLTSDEYEEMITISSNIGQSLD